MVIERRAIWGRGSPFPLDDVSPDDLAWLVSRVREAELQTWGHAGLPATKILTNIIQERKEEEEMNKAREELGAVGKEKIVNLEFLNMVDVNLSGVEGEILAGGVVKIKQVALADTRLTTGQVNKLA